jgi:hypothetical protein
VRERRALGVPGLARAGRERRPHSPSPLCSSCLLLLPPHTTSSFAGVFRRDRSHRAVGDLDERSCTGDRVHVGTSTSGLYAPSASMNNGEHGVYAVSDTGGEDAGGECARKSIMVRPVSSPACQTHEGKLSVAASAEHAHRTLT